jgi:hypothetical protein
MWLAWQPAVALAIVLAAAGVSLRRSGGRAAAVGAVAREAALVLALYAFWRVVMALRSTRLDEGLAHGRTVYDVERFLHIGNEADMARWLVAHPFWANAANTFYAVVHVPALIAFLVWLFFRHRDQYPRMRNTVAALTGICLVVHWFPVAPPRMFPNFGFVDVARQFGQSVYGPVGQGISNQVSALPSLHAGWALIVALGVLLASTSRWRWLVLAHPVLTIVVIAATANHWWLDSVASAGVLAVVVALQWALARVRGRAPAFGLGAEPVVDESGDDEGGRGPSGLEPDPVPAPA